MTTEPTPANDRELVLTRLVDVLPDRLYHCWTEPSLLAKWFAPKPWTVRSADVDVRPGGASNIVMCSPDGQDMPSQGVYLEVVPNEKLVFTDAFLAGWEPSEKPFMVVEVTFALEGDRTRYTARARHWTAEACTEHAQMGFHAGWGLCTDQLVALAKTL
jgi:uncharacterized protein YndB with AHSA1/START domain